MEIASARQRILPGALRKNKIPPTEQTLWLSLLCDLCSVLPLFPVGYMAAPTSASPNWCLMFPFPSIASSPRATPRLGTESRSLSICRRTHTLGALGRQGGGEQVEVEVEARSRAQS